MESACTHTRTYSHMHMHHVFHRDTHIRYTCAICDRTRDCAKRALVQTFSRNTYMQCTDQHVAKIRTYVVHARVCPCINCTLHACTRALMQRERLSACVRVYASVARRILDIVRVHTITRTRPVGFEFSSRALLHRELFPRYTSNRFRPIHPLSRSSRQHVPRNVRTFS